MANSQNTADEVNPMVINDNFPLHTSPFLVNQVNGSEATNAHDDLDPVAPPNTLHPASPNETEPTGASASLNVQAVIDRLNTLDTQSLHTPSENIVLPGTLGFIGFHTIIGALGTVYEEEAYETLRSASLPDLTGPVQPITSEVETRQFSAGRTASSSSFLSTLSAPHEENNNTTDNIPLVNGDFIHSSFHPTTLSSSTITDSENPEDNPANSLTLYTHPAQVNGIQHTSQRRRTFEPPSSITSVDSTESLSDNSPDNNNNNDLDLAATDPSTPPGRAFGTGTRHQAFYIDARGHWITLGPTLPDGSESPARSDPLVLDDADADIPHLELEPPYLPIGVPFFEFEDPDTETSYFTDSDSEGPEIQVDEFERLQELERLEIQRLEQPPTDTEQADLEGPAVHTTYFEQIQDFDRLERQRLQQLSTYTDFPEVEDPEAQAAILERILERERAERLQRFATILEEPELEDLEDQAAIRERLEQLPSTTELPEPEDLESQATVLERLEQLPSITELPEPEDLATQAGVLEQLPAITEQPEPEGLATQAGLLERPERLPSITEEPEPEGLESQTAECDRLQELERLQIERLEQLPTVPAEDPEASISDVDTDRPQPVTISCTATTEDPAAFTSSNPSALNTGL